MPLSSHTKHKGLYSGISASSSLCGVIGNPVSHSLSPIIHNHWYRANAIDAVYLALKVDVGMVRDVLSTLMGIGARGVNVTLPHKLEALAACDMLTARASKIGATNSLHFKDCKIIGDNTDSEGFARDLRKYQERYFPHRRSFRKVCMWGAGGAAQAVLYALLDFQVEEILLVNRTLEKAEKMGGSLEGISFRSVSSLENEGNFLSDCDLFINATSQGMWRAGDANGIEKDGHGQVRKTQAGKDKAVTEKTKSEFPPPFADFVTSPESRLVYDLVYNPAVTPFMQKASAIGMKTAGGLGMLVSQAAISCEQWFGVSPVIGDDFLRSLTEMLPSE